MEFGGAKRDRILVAKTIEKNKKYRASCVATVEISVAG
jgi:hypothetical protein